MSDEGGGEDTHQRRITDSHTKQREYTAADPKERTEASDAEDRAGNRRRNEQSEVGPAEHLLHAKNLSDYRAQSPENCAAHRLSYQACSSTRIHHGRQFSSHRDRVAMLGLPVSGPAGVLLRSAGAGGARGAVPVA